MQNQKLIIILRVVIGLLLTIVIVGMFLVWWEMKVSKQITENSKQETPTSDGSTIYRF